MDRQLARVRKAYDLTVGQHKGKTDPLDDIPEELKNLPGYKSLMADRKVLGSGAPDIKEYLAPKPGMQFLDAGCSANIVNYTLDQWSSRYFGIDISPRLINAMKEFVSREQISIGGLYITDITRLPFDDSFFDIAAVIGLLEYCTLKYIRKALFELNRVMKPESRAVLDIPNQNHPHARDMSKLEKHLARPIFLHPRLRFEKLLMGLFSMKRIDDSRLMIKYFVRTIK